MLVLNTEKHLILKDFLITKSIYTDSNYELLINFYEDYYEALNTNDEYIKKVERLYDKLLLVYERIEKLKRIL